MGEGELKMSERPVEINKIKPSDYEMAGLSDIVRDYIFDLEQEIEAWEKLDKENPRLDREELSAEIHKCYCRAYERRFGKPYFTNGDYSKLDEPTKDYDREMADWVIKTFGQPKDAIRSCNCNKTVGMTMRLVCDGIAECPRCGGVVVTKPKDAVSELELIKYAINDWLSCGESRLTPDDVEEIAETIYNRIYASKLKGQDNEAK